MDVNVKLTYKQRKQFHCHRYSRHGRFAVPLVLVGGEKEILPARCVCFSFRGQAECRPRTFPYYASLMEKAWFRNSTRALKSLTRRAHKCCLILSGYNFNLSIAFVI